MGSQNFLQNNTQITVAIETIFHLTQACQAQW